ncbi:M23 family metallopeptidase [Sporosarcina sp. G11-34]|uniref:M23 family metallopeptidase n=1 Tax=Sporosarcina sp. G11-34 TaxID=2849605 RepID=UPI0022A9790F|nr:M23 family metallopeptidase [Sporosarcina sp. G11-34]MCZ2258348.1 M23 family metallopeptidase [Sporosarcina sp. G11-34]
MYWFRSSFSVVVFFLFLTSVVAAEEQPTREEVLEERMEYYMKYSSVTLPWYYLAAVDQFERNIQQVRSDIPKKEGPIAIQFSDEFWLGILNPYIEDTSPASIAFFGGLGQDGNQDGIADSNNDDDVLYTMATYLASYGYTENDFKKAIKNYYENEDTVKQIMAISKLYSHYQTLNLDKRVFPLPVNHNYSYRSTWGAGRGWGGRRIHEGTDLFASYGVPVRAVTYGVVEAMGWNDFGGWRVGVRDIHNTYHYYAHLSGYNKEVKEGDIVEPGTVLGWVGSSGYGKEGTSGRFPPHLHFGMYKYNGRTEWAFDPFPYLRIWEQQDRNATK